MRQTLFYIPPEIDGFPVFGFGLMFAVWAVAAIGLLALSWWRMGWSKETLSYVPLLALIGAVIVVLMPALAEPQGLPIRGYGVMMVCGVAGGVGLSVHRARQRGIDAELIFSLGFWMFILGMLGARLFYIIEYWDQFQLPTIRETLMAMINVPQGGLVVYGSAFGAGLALLLFVRKHRLPGLALADLITPSLLVGLAFGRIGCFFNGCCFGGPCELPWAVQFPAGSPPYGRQLEQGQLYGIDLDREAPNGAVIIKRVAAGSFAEQYGLKAGTHITKINGLEPRSSREAAEVLHSTLLSGAPHVEVKGLQLRSDSDKREILQAAFFSGAQNIKINGQAPLSPGKDAVEMIQAAIAAGDLNIEISGFEPKAIDILQTAFSAGVPNVRINGKESRSISEAIDRLQASFSDRATIGLATDQNKVNVPPYPDSYLRSLPVHPAQLYSTLDAMLICLFLLAYDPYRRRDGELLAWCFTIYPVTRYLIEVIRTDELGMFGTILSISQIISLILLFVVACFWLYLSRQPRRVVWPA